MVTVPPVPQRFRDAAIYACGSPRPSGSGGTSRLLIAAEEVGRCSGG